MNKSLLSFSVNIITKVTSEPCFDYVFKSSYLNSETFGTNTNKALIDAVEYLETKNDTDKIGILVTCMINEYSNTFNRYIGSGDVCNLFSHICCNGSNWVTVNEAKCFIKGLMN